MSPEDMQRYGESPEERADRLAHRWIVATIAATIAYVALAAIGIDLFGLPLALLVWLSFALMMRHRGWRDGYRARRAEEHGEVCQ